MSPDFDARLSAALKSAGDDYLRQNPSDLETARRLVARRRRTRAVMALAAIALAVVVVVAVPRLVFDEASRRVDDSGPVAPVHAVEVETLRAGTGVRAIAASEDGAWMSTAHVPLLRVDAEARKVRPVRIRGLYPLGYADLAVDGDTLWAVASGGPAGGPGVIQRIDPGTRSVRLELEMGRDRPYALTLAHGSAWVANSAGSEVWRVDRARGSIEATIRVPPAPTSIAAGPDAVWVVSGRARSLVRVDPATDRVVGEPTRLGKCASAVAVEPAAVWVTDYCRHVLFRLDPATRDLQATIPTGREPTDVVVHGEYVWVVNTADGTVTRVDRRTNEVVGEAIKVGREPAAAAGARGTVWVTNFGGGSVSRITGH